MKTYKYKGVTKNFHENIKHPFPMDKLKKMNMSMMIKIRTAVAPCYELLTLFTLLALLVLLALLALLALLTLLTMLFLLTLHSGIDAKKRLIKA